MEMIEGTKTQVVNTVGMGYLIRELVYNKNRIVINMTTGNITERTDKVSYLSYPTTGITLIELNRICGYYPPEPPAEEIMHPPPKTPEALKITPDTYLKKQGDNKQKIHPNAQGKTPLAANTSAEDVTQILNIAQKEANRSLNRSLNTSYDSEFDVGTMSLQEKQIILKERRKENAREPPRSEKPQTKQPMAAQQQTSNLNTTAMAFVPNANTCTLGDAARNTKEHRVPPSLDAQPMRHSSGYNPNLAVLAIPHQQPYTHEYGSLGAMDPAFMQQIQQFAQYQQHQQNQINLNNQRINSNENNFQQLQQGFNIPPQSPIYFQPPTPDYTQNQREESESSDNAAFPQYQQYNTDNGY
jgi:hypothetical protein